MGILIFAFIVCAIGAVIAGIKVLNGTENLLSDLWRKRKF